MFAAADEADFPILLTSYEVRFSRISHIVALANTDDHVERLTQSLRILERVSRLAVADAVPSGFDLLADELGCDIVLLDPSTWCAVPPTEPTLVTDELVAAVRSDGDDALAAERPWPTTVAGRPALVTPILEPRPLVLVALPRTEQRPDLLLLEQVATVISVEQAYVVAARERNRRLRSSALAHIVDRRIDEQLAAEALEEANITRPTRLLALVGDDNPATFGDLHHALDDAGIDHMMLLRRDVLLLLISDDRATIDTVLARLPTTARAGISSSTDAIAGLGECHREARTALRTTTGRHPTAWYEDAHHRSPLLPLDPADTRELALDVLGELLAYDAAHDAELATTLLVFLEEDRRWQRAADLLFVHRQTLVYRIKRIEALIGRNLRSTADVAEVWLALQAAIETGLIS